MKMITCVIRPEKLEEVTNALNKIDVVGMTVTDVRGFGRQKGQLENYRGGEYAIRFIPKVRIDLAVPDEQVDPILRVVQEAAFTGKTGDGKIFISEITEAMRVRTGEKGLRAL